MTRRTQHEGCFGLVLCALGLLAPALPAGAAPPSVVLSEVIASSDADPLGGHFSVFFDPILVTRQVVAFDGQTTGLFRESGGVLTSIAVSGDPSPLGGTFALFGPPAVGPSSVAAFRAIVNGGSSRQGIFLYASGVVTPLVVSGDPVPGGGTYTTFLRNVSINGSGAVAFGASQGIFVWSGGVVSSIARVGDPSPCGGSFRSFGGTAHGPVINNAGNLAFEAASTGGVDGVFRVSGGVMSAIACEGGVTPIGGTWQALGRSPTINNLGDVIFQGQVTPGAITGVFLSSPTLCSPSSPCKVAVEGDAAPGGDVFVDFPASMIPAIDDTVTAAFPARTSTVRGVYSFSGGSLSAVVRAGDSCSVGGVFLSVRNELAFNASGNLVFSAACSGNSGIFRFPAGGPLTPGPQRTDATPIGAGFQFITPAIDGGGAVTFNGNRIAAYAMACRASGCADVTALVRPLDPAPGFPGELIEAPLTESKVGSGAAVAMFASTFGTGRHDMLVLSRRGTLQKIAASDDPAPVPGTTFQTLSAPNLLLGGDTTVKPSISGTRVAFTADLSDFTSGIFLWRNGVMSTVVHEGDPAPNGGTFGSFSEPSLRGRTVVFAADTGVATCMFRSPRTGVFQSVVCVGDAVPAPVGGTIDGFLTAPVYGGGMTFFDASVSGGTSTECLLRRRGRVLEKIACVGETGPGGVTYTFFENLNSTPWVAQSGRAAAAFAQVFDGVSDIQEITFFRGGTATKIIADNDPLPAPIGGVVGVPLDADVFSLFGNRLVFEAAVSGGARSSGVFMATVQ